MTSRIVTVAAAALLAAGTLLADVSYQENSKVTGGAMAGMMKVVGVFSKDAREGMQATISVKGDRMARRSTNHVEIIDVGAETITSVDLQKKTYSVMTFAQMKQILEEAMQKVQDSKSKNADVKWKVSANATGNTKMISGYDAKEMVLKMTMEGTDQKSGQKGAMVVTSRVWVASGVPGYAEMRDFQKRMAAKLAWTPGSNMFMANPEVGKGLAESFKEVSKLDGAPVLMITSMGAEGTAPPEGAPAAQPEQKQQSRTGLGGALGGALGGRFGLGGKKKNQDQAQEAPASAASGSLIDMTTESSNFSTGAVDASVFSIPAGFKKVDPPNVKNK